MLVGGSKKKKNTLKGNNWDYTREFRVCYEVGEANRTSV